MLQCISGLTPKLFQMPVYNKYIIGGTKKVMNEELRKSLMKEQRVRNEGTKKVMNEGTKKAMNEETKKAMN